MNHEDLSADEQQALAEFGELMQETVEVTCLLPKNQEPTTLKMAYEGLNAVVASKETFCRHVEMEFIVTKFAGAPRGRLKIRRQGLTPFGEVLCAGLDEAFERANDGEESD